MVESDLKDCAITCLVGREQHARQEMTKILEMVWLLLAAFLFLCFVIAAFIFAFVASFWGSLPPGPGNLAVLHTVLNKNTKAALWMALGASVPELPYSYLSVVAIHYVHAFESIDPILQVVMMLILLGVGIYTTFFQANKKVDVDATTKVERIAIHPFWKGVLIALFNPMLVAFWLIASKMGADMGWVNVHSVPEQLAFVLGTALGAFALLVLVAEFTGKIKQRLTPAIIVNLNKAIGITFLVLGVLQAIRVGSLYLS